MKNYAIESRASIEENYAISRLKGMKISSYRTKLEFPKIQIQIESQIEKIAESVNLIGL